MGCGILRGQKIKSDGIKGMEIHVNRERRSRSNPDIDRTRTKENFSLLPIDKTPLNKKVAARIAELPGQKTKTGKTRKIQSNAVLLYDFIITSDHETMMSMTPADQKDFFTDALKFFRKNFGAANIMYAEVHMDERTPHLHLGLVPEHKGKLSARDLFTPESCRKLQNNFFAEVSSRYGMERGEVGSEAKHKSAVELRAETLAEVKAAEERAKAANTEAEAAEKRLSKALKKEKAVGDEKEWYQAIEKSAYNLPLKDGVLGIGGKIRGYEHDPIWTKNVLRLARFGAVFMDGRIMWSFR